MNDKEILYSIIGREIDNLLSGNPSLFMFRGAIKNWVFNYIEPYVNFFLEDEKLNTKMAEAYIKDEASKKLAAFKAKFMEEQTNEEDK
jgi:hypothetical protein